MMLHLIATEVRNTEHIGIAKLEFLRHRGADIHPGPVEGCHVAAYAHGYRSGQLSWV